VSPAASSAAVAAREILRRLHDVMASKTGAQAKLNRVVAIIAEALDSEVCSIYLLRDGVLELFATKGLAQEAVHVTKLALGQGLVGTIAATRAPLNLAEAEAHPAFVYRPETGEELFHSFAGVPIIRREASVGVLCVQHAEPRDYQDVEIEALQTTAMVLSELIASAGLIDDVSIARVRAQAGDQVRLVGLKLVDGLARGIAVFHQPRVVIEHTVADDIEAERKRVYDAFIRMREQIDRMMGQAEFAGPGDHEDILETYKMLPTTKAGRGASTKRSTAASPPRRRSRASSSACASGCRRSTTLTCASESTTSTTCPTGSSGSCRASSGPPRSSASSRTRSSSRATSARPSCSNTTAATSREWCWRKARSPRTSPSSRARWACRCWGASATCTARSPTATRCCSTPARARCSSGRRRPWSSSSRR